jgi:hypothetical protein
MSSPTFIFFTKEIVRDFTCSKSKLMASGIPLDSKSSIRLLVVNESEPISFDGPKNTCSNLFRISFVI